MVEATDVQARLTRPEDRVRPARPNPTDVSAVGSTAMLSTSHPVATEAGLSVLRRGGSAVDAYVAAAAVQTVVEPVMTSLAGGLAINVYDPAAGDSLLLAGVGGLPSAEDGKLDDVERWTGRTVVPPGWVRGAQVAWERWGKLPWADLFSGALACAREGFVVDQQLWGYMFESRTVPGKYASGRDVWFPDGHMVGVGEVLRQPALADTIEQLAEQGPDYFYEGDFARHYVDVAQQAGGRITLDDMAATAGWVGDPLPPLSVAGGYELHTFGVMYALAMNLAAVGEIAKRPHPTEDGETLYLLMRIFEETWHHCLELAETKFDGTPSIDSVVDDVTAEVAERIWPQVVEGPPRPIEPMNLNTNAIVAVDESGLIAHGTHSTSSTPFGVGLMVDGVLVPRSMVYFSTPVVKMPIGWATSMLAFRDGRPVFTAGSPSISAIQCVLQNTLNVLEWGLAPDESVQLPRFGASHYPSTRPMVESTMGDEVIADVERRGLGVTRVSPWEPEMGSCHAIRIEDDGTLHGAADPRRMGRAAGY